MRRVPPKARCAAFPQSCLLCSGEGCIGGYAQRGGIVQQIAFLRVRGARFFVIASFEA